MHRFDEKSRIPFIKNMHDQGLFASISVGVKAREFDFIEQLQQADIVPEYITIDIAHGHSDLVIRMIKHIKQHLPQAFVIAGNVGTPEGVRGIRKCRCRCDKGWYWTRKSVHYQNKNWIWNWRLATRCTQFVCKAA